MRIRETIAIEKIHIQRVFGLLSMILSIANYVMLAYMTYVAGQKWIIWTLPIFAIFGIAMYILDKVLFFPVEVDYGYTRNKQLIEALGELKK